MRSGSEARVVVVLPVLMLMAMKLPLHPLLLWLPSTDLRLPLLLHHDALPTSVVAHLLPSPTR